MQPTKRKAIGERIADAIRAKYPLPPELARLRGLATFDLWHGPMPVGFRDDGDDGEPWPGFVVACERLRAWADETLPSTLWYDDDNGELLDSEPQGWHDEETGEWNEPYLDETYKVERRQIMQARFPNELAGYL